MRQMRSQNMREKARQVEAVSFQFISLKEEKHELGIRGRDPSFKIRHFALQKAKDIEHTLMFLLEQRDCKRKLLISISKS